MASWKEFAVRKPVLFGALILILAIDITEIPLKSLLVPLLPDQLADYLSGALLQFLVGAFLVALIVRLGLLSKAGFRAPAHWRDLWLAWPLAALALLNASELFTGGLVIDHSQPARIILLALVMLSVGFFEEVLARGLILVVMLQKWGSTRRGIYLSVIVSSLLFGVAHLVNFLQNRYTLGANLLQITYAFFFAVMFAACFLRFKSIWPGVFLHALFDFAGNLNEIAVGGGISTVAKSVTLHDAILAVLLTLPMFLWGLYILRVVKPSGAEPRGGLSQKSRSVIEMEVQP